MRTYPTFLCVPVSGCGVGGDRSSCRHCDNLWLGCDRGDPGWRKTRVQHAPSNSDAPSLQDTVTVVALAVCLNNHSAAVALPAIVATLVEPSLEHA